jgi:hypothetical protein
MNMRVVFVGVALVFSIPLFAREQTDILVMKNGDRMTCQIKGLSAGVLYVSFDYIDGTASVDWSKVARLESNQTFIVKTQDGSVYTGRLNTPKTPAGQPVTIRILETPEKQTVLESPQVVEMVETSQNFWRRFNGDVSFGTTYSKGNQTTQYTLGSEALYLRERWSALVRFDSNLSSSSGANTSTRNSLEFNGRRLLPWKNYFYTGIGGSCKARLRE